MFHGQEKKTHVQFSTLFISGTQEIREMSGVQERESKNM